jgi:hypothetical protein
VELITALFALTLALLARLALPIVITLVLVFFLRKLDARWQEEAQHEPPTVEKPECWKSKGCSAEQRANCPAFSSSQPCWQVYRQPNGYLNEKCLTCKVFIDAPIPYTKMIQGESKV